MRYIKCPHFGHSKCYIYHAVFLTVCALHLEMHKEESIGNEFEESSGEIENKDKQLLESAGLASVIRKLKKQISKTTLDYIKKKLGMVCDEIGFLKTLCRKLVNRYMDILVEELSTTDDTRTICANIGVCKK
ncbi:hypothetical protein cypCar_00036716 [Cyprinus carpio]|nr:hypothetical protein cypCar_00036716 [Cyprinus carpio]